MTKLRMQYAYPDRPRVPAVAKPRGPFVAMRNGVPAVVVPSKIGGERSKYQPHQGKAECARRAAVERVKLEAVA
jgi:hypothetical protein